MTGTLTINGSPPTTIAPIAPFIAQPIAAVDPTKFTDTLNFLIPADSCTGTLSFEVQASVGANLSNVASASVSFVPVPQLDILVLRIRVGTVSEPSRTEYFAAVNKLPLIYPIPTDPAVAIRYWMDPGSEVVVNTHDLTTEDGMNDLLDDLEDIQEDYDDSVKGYGLVSRSYKGLNRFGISRRGDNVGFGWPFIMESVGHEIGHLYCLKHAPCGGPDDPDDHFVPRDGSIGDVGVDPVGQVAFAAGTSDFMSYCVDRGATSYENQWVSAYHWTKLLVQFVIGL